MPRLPQLIEEDVQELGRALQELLVTTDASVALVIDKGGFLISQSGEFEAFDTTTLAALSAASFAATQGIATLVNENNFSSVYQQGDHYSLLVLNIDEYCLMTVVFRANISVGAIKYFGQTTVADIAAQMKRAQQRDPDKGLDLSMLNLADTAPVFR